MIRSARAMASEIAYSEAGEFLPSHCDNFRAAGMQAAIMRITRFLPSSVTTSVAYSSFVRYKRICPDISNFGICTASLVRIGAKLNNVPAYGALLYRLRPISRWFRLCQNEPHMHLRKATLPDETRPESALERSNRTLITYASASESFRTSAAQLIQHLHHLVQARDAYGQAITASRELRAHLDAGDENLRALMNQMEQVLDVPLRKFEPDEMKVADEAEPAGRKEVVSHSAKKGFL